MALAAMRDGEIASLIHVTNVFTTSEHDFQKGASDVSNRIIASSLASLAEALAAPGEG